MHSWPALWRALLCGITLAVALCFGVVPHAPATSGGSTGAGQPALAVDTSWTLAAAVTADGVEQDAWRADAGSHGADCADVAAFTSARSSRAAAELLRGTLAAAGQPESHRGQLTSLTEPSVGCVGLAIRSAAVIRA